MSDVRVFFFAFKDHFICRDCYHINFKAHTVVSSDDYRMTRASLQYCREIAFALK